MSDNHIQKIEAIIKSIDPKWLESNIIYYKKNPIDVLPTDSCTEMFAKESDAEITNAIESDACFSSMPQDISDDLIRVAIACGRLAIHENSQIAIAINRSAKKAMILLTAPLFLMYNHQLAILHSIILGASEIMISSTDTNDTKSFVSVVFDFSKRSDKIINSIRDNLLKN